MSRRKQIGAKARFEIFKRDSFTCQYCGAEAPGAVLHVDHILPVAKGGDNKITNLITACSECNMGKGARKLNDDSAVARQKQQLNELNERREQLEMIQQWRTGLSDLAEQEVDIANSHWEELADGFSLNDLGQRQLSRLVKKHGAIAVMEAMDSSVDRNLEYSSDGSPTKESVEATFRNLESTLKYLALPDLEKKIRYINGIIRNRVRNFSWARQDELKSVLREFARIGGDLDTAESIAKVVDHHTIDDFFADMREEIAANA
jgi:hypothetical protein